jgi:hypothetical protein
MARAGSGAIACGIRERWHVDKRPYPQSALGGSDSTRPAWRAVTIETTITALDLPPLPQDAVPTDTLLPILYQACGQRPRPLAGFPGITARQGRPDGPGVIHFTCEVAQTYES